MPDGIAIADRVAGVLHERDDVVAAYLFGSRSSHRPRHDSDVDVAIIFDSTRSPEARFEARCELSGRIASAADVDRADVVDLELAPPLLAHEILRTGRLLFSRDEHRRVRVVARQIMRYIDTRPLRRMLDAATFRRLKEGSFGRLA